MNQKRVVVCREGGYLHSGIFILDGALEPAKDYISVLSHIGRAGRRIGLASHFERDDEGAISFVVTLEEYLNHDNFDWHIFMTGTEYDCHETPLGEVAGEHPIYRQRAVSKATVQAVLGHHIRYTPRSTSDE